MNLLLIIIISVLWGGADFLRKLSSGSDSQLLSFIFNLGATLSPLFVLLWMIFKKQPVKYCFNHLMLSLLGGGLVGIGGIILYYLLSKSSAVSITFPLIRVGSLIIVVLSGFIFLSEPITLKILLGIVFSLIGAFFLILK